MCCEHKAQIITYYTTLETRDYRVQVVLATKQFLDWSVCHSSRTSSRVQAGFEHVWQLPERAKFPATSAPSIKYIDECAATANLV